MFENNLAHRVSEINVTKNNIYSGIFNFTTQPIFSKKKDRLLI